jgi:hypothetical protein
MFDGRKIRSQSIKELQFDRRLDPLKVKLDRKYLIEFKQGRDVQIVAGIAGGAALM